VAIAAIPGFLYTTVVELSEVGALAHEGLRPGRRKRLIPYLRDCGIVRLSGSGIEFAHPLLLEALGSLSGYSAHDLSSSFSTHVVRDHWGQRHVILKVRLENDGVNSLEVADLRIHGRASILSRRASLTIDLIDGDSVSQLEGPLLPYWLPAGGMEYWDFRVDKAREDGNFLPPDVILARLKHGSLSTRLGNGQTVTYRSWWSVDRC
jgi:hypothetical protein